MKMARLVWCLTLMNCTIEKGKVIMIGTCGYKNYSDYKKLVNSLYGDAGLLSSTKYVKNVIFNDPATIVFWVDGSKTVVKCGENDTFDPEKGLAMAIAKRALGNQGNYYNHIKKWLLEEELSSKKTMGGNEYISRPVKIRAIQWTGSNTDELEDFLGVEDLIFQDIITWAADKHGPGCFKIKTLEGPMLAVPGDYIIKGLRNEFYPCKPDVFKKKYRLMDDE